MHEGASQDDRYVNPAAQWSPTSTASPSGIAILDDVAYVASLRGEVLWQVPLSGTKAGTPIALRLGDRGRLRTVAVAPDGALWLITSNTDGRGSPRSGDDRSCDSWCDDVVVDPARRAPLTVVLVVALVLALGVASYVLRATNPPSAFDPASHPAIAAESPPPAVTVIARSPPG